jgi:hypothetical protein
MWTLFVLSIVYATDTELDMRYTRYAEFENLWDCNITKEELEKEFKMNEIAICYQIGNPIPSLDTLY